MPAFFIAQKTSCWNCSLLILRTDCAKGNAVSACKKPQTIKRLFNDLRFLGIEPDVEMERGALVMHTDDTGYLTNGKFEPDRMMELLLNTISDCVKRGSAASAVPEIYLGGSGKAGLQPSDRL